MKAKTPLRNHAVPKLLQDVISRTTKLWFQLDFEFDLNAHQMMDDLPSPTVAEVVPFAYDGAHRYYGFWLPEGKTDLATAPIVFVDNEGGVSSCILASSLVDFLSMALVAGPQTPAYVDTLFDALESQERAAKMPPYIGHDLRDVLTAAGSEATAWSKLVEHQRSQVKVPAELVVVMAELGVTAAPPASVVERVRAARKAHPPFQLA